MAETTPEQLRNAGFTEAQATVLGGKLDYIEMRLDHIEARLDKVEARLEKLESRMTQILLALPALFIAQTTALALILG